jgi:peptidoglycan/xylan/chitin deacetylase (PgdA/CDA1 family)
MVCDICKRAGLGILQWSVDPKDWCCDDAAAIESAVVESVRSGDVILLHDMSESSVEAALAIVDKLRAKGFQFVTATQLARLKGVTIEPGKVYERF